LNKQQDTGSARRFNCHAELVSASPKPCYTISMPLAYIKDGKVEYRTFFAPPKAPAKHKDEQKKETQKNAIPDFSFGVNGAKSGDYRDTWRVFRIMSEFVEGYQFLSTFHHEVTLFGGARFKKGSAYYKMARELGKLLAGGGYTTITGGGPGIMEAANEGAYLGGGESLGINIQLPFEQRINPYVKKSIALHYFFTRKVMFAVPAQAFVYFPGGFGTLDEFWEIIDLMDNGYLTKTPIILVGKKYWKPLLDWLPHNSVYILTPSEKKILAACHVVDSAQDAFDIIKTTKDAPESCELSPGKFHCEGQVNWRIFRIMAEVVEGFDFLTGLVKDITVFGTKGISKLSPYCKSAEKFGALAAKAGFSVVTGGYSGIAEAANKGAFEQGGDSIGLYMRENQKNTKPNPYLSRSLAFAFPFTRKLVLTAPSKGFVMFPGGLGTLHQTMEVLTLVQTKKIPRLPIVLFGSAFWSPFVTWMKELLAKKYNAILPTDAELFTITDDPEEALKVIEEAYRA